jgi:hypothetical protein
MRGWSGGWVGSGPVDCGLGMSSWCSGLVAISGWMAAGVVDDCPRMSSFWSGRWW